MMGSKGPRERDIAPSPRRGSALRLKVELWLALIFMTASFGAGLFVGNLSGSPQDSQGPVVEAPPAGDVPAPPLTDEQLDEGLPPGHPPIGGSAEVPEAERAEERAGGKRDDGSRDSSTAPNPARSP